ncbi:MAG: putative hydroxymethylpyrimidine transporter CytX [Desulfobacteraceae bacterium]|jgi:putative hydroxymethylpyrimidine transporter CytX|nr:MAG: putative hydroxymethylpyrimidine transporter CytX [Desulfobacteraceae bacterium]
MAEKILPIEQGGRTFTGIDFFLLWSGAAVSLAEIWAGGLLVPMGFGAGILAIIIGHLVGNTPLALGGVIGSRTGLTTMMTVRPSFGVKGSYFAALLNVIQLIGWTGVMLWIGGQAAQAVFPISGWGFRWWVLAAGVITTVWAIVGSRYWKWVQRIAVLGLMALCVLMTYVVFNKYGWDSLTAVRPKGGMPFMVGLDIVVAMPVSWLPLVCDYSRFARSSVSSFWGTWIGYFLVSSWMYVVGLAAALATASATPESMVLQLMVGMGFILPALIIVLFSTFTTTFLDIYSGAVSALNIWPRFGERSASFVCGVLGTCLAMVFPATAYEGFLLLVGSVFCPLFGVVLADFFIMKGGNYSKEEMRSINPRAFLAWGIGLALYHVLQRTTEIGSSIPSLVTAGFLYVLFMKAAKNSINGE